MTVGVILNRPSIRSLDATMREVTNKLKNSPAQQLKVPLRYGGCVSGTEPVLWLHCNAKLKATRVGVPVGNNENDKDDTDEAGIWKCSNHDMMLAVGQGLATPQDFLVVTGVSVWSKLPGGTSSQGMQGELQEGRFQKVPLSQTEDVWNELLKQDVLTDRNIWNVLDVAELAWQKAADANNKNKKR